MSGWLDSKQHPTPKDGTRIYVANIPAPADQCEAAVMFCDDGFWVQGGLAIGERGDDWDHWMPLPAPPEGDDLRGWIDAKVTPPVKDGSSYLFLYRHEGKWHHLAFCWVTDDWQCEDLGLPGVWSDGLLGCTSQEPDYWMPVPPLPGPPCT